MINVRVIKVSDVGQEELVTLRLDIRLLEIGLAVPLFLRLGGHGECIF
jgi:hypothetical protein